MKNQADSTNLTDTEALNRALIQCLRLFAKHGRKIRYQERTINEKPLDNADMEKEMKIYKDQEAD